MQRPEKNILYYGDNLQILREYIADESVNLIYLDPPFNSKRTYNVLFKDESGKDSQAQIAAFDDTWHWDTVAEETYYELITNAPDAVSRMIGALREFIGTNQMMAYLVMMAVRLVELHRVLKPTGSLYLHCDPTASHYLKVVLDTVFGVQNFRNEVVWQRTATKGDARQKYGAVHDTILYYTKTNQSQFQPVFLEPDEAYVSRFKLDDKDGKGPYRLAPLDSPNPRPNLTYEYKGYAPPVKGWRVSRQVMEQLDKEGRLYFPKKKTGRIARKHYLAEQQGRKASDVWTDIPPLQASAAERLGYPTQKPLALLERIIQASSKEGDVVLDPFCGCGTTIAAAEKLNRRWIGIDITHLSIALQKYRLQESFPSAEFEVVGEPKSVGAARFLAEQDRFQFEWWALSLVRARPGKATGSSKRGKKGADRGIDGVINFVHSTQGKAGRVLVQVKSGHVSSRDIRDLVGTVEREKAAIGVLITLETPSKPMTTEAVSTGFYESPIWRKKYPKIQILTIEELLNGGQIEMPPAWGTFKQAKRMERDADTPKQAAMF